MCLRNRTYYHALEFLDKSFAGPGLFLRNKMSLNNTLALLGCFILFSDKKHHRALVFPHGMGCPIGSPTSGSLDQRMCWRWPLRGPPPHTPLPLSRGQPRAHGGGKRENQKNTVYRGDYEFFF